MESVETQNLIKAENEGFRSGKSCVDHIFTLKQMGEKAKVVCWFYRSGEDLDMEVLWQGLRIYDVGGKPLNGI